MEQLADKAVAPERGALGGWGMGFQLIRLGFHPILGCAPMRTRVTCPSPGENRVGTPQRKALGVESAGKVMRALRPTGKAAGQCEGFAGAGGGGSRRLGIHQSPLAGKGGNNRAGLGDPTLEVK